MNKLQVETETKTRTSTATKVLKGITVTFVAVFVLSWLFVLRLIVSNLN